MNARDDGEPMSRGPLVRFENVTKHFGPVTAVRNLSLDVFPGEFLALLGPSGCGKTTLLRLLAGFETADEGRVLLDGRDLSGVPPYRRPLNTMFQSYALFPHLTVGGNISFGLRYDGVSKAEAARRVDEMLALVKLEGKSDRRPHELSGGQRQRVALARALAKRPRLLLLDEPMAALDRKLRESTQLELAGIQRKLGTTFIIVTHDQEEAMALADRIAVMEQGRIAQIDTPIEVYERPASRYVADFLGNVNLVEGRLAVDERGQSVVVAGRLSFHTASAPEGAPGATVWLAIRPEKIAIVPAAGPAPETSVAQNHFPGRVAELSYRGDVSTYIVDLDGGPRIKVMGANSGTADASKLHQNDRVLVSFSREAGRVLAL